MKITITEEQYRRIFNKTNNIVLEQTFLDKAKSKIQNLATNISNKLQPNQQPVQQPTTQEISPALKEYNDFVNKWKQVNDDPNSNLVLIEGNDNGRSSSYGFEMGLQMDAVSMYVRKLMEKTGVKIYANEFKHVRKVDWVSYLKPNEKGVTITYGAYLFEIKK